MGVLPEKLKLLAAPFSPDDLEWRVGRIGQSGKGPWAHVLAYQTSRAVMDRFDEVCGPENWSNEFRAGPGGGVICRISVNIDGVGWVSKEDGAENTDIEAVKGGLSGAMKRAAVQWGCGRYLYGIEESFALVHEFAANSAGKGDDRFRWNPPALPDWALPPEELTHQELLAFIKAHYKQGDARSKLGETWVRISEFVVAQADLLKRDYYLARQVASELGSAAGVPLRRPGGEAGQKRAA